MLRQKQQYPQKEGCSTSKQRTAFFDITNKDINNDLLKKYLRSPIIYKHTQKCEACRYQANTAFAAETQPTVNLLQKFWLSFGVLPSQIKDNVFVHSAIRELILADPNNFYNYTLIEYRSAIKIKIPEQIKQARIDLSKISAFLKTKQNHDASDPNTVSLTTLNLPPDIFSFNNLTAEEIYGLICLDLNFLQVKTERFYILLDLFLTNGLLGPENFSEALTLSNEEFPAFVNSNLHFINWKIKWQDEDILRELEPAFKLLTIPKEREEQETTQAFAHFSPARG